MREKIQRFGGFMAGMVIPNIAAIIAWGLITAFFISYRMDTKRKIG